MTIANVSIGSFQGLPQALRTAQDSIGLPEVQEMMQKLSAYNLGIFMPHMHDEETGEFKPLSDGFIQVESDLQVSFQPQNKIATQPDRFLSVGWFWRDGAPIPLAACEMVEEEGEGNEQRSIKHKMINKPNVKSS